jgi:WD40 repeat protein
MGYSGNDNLYVRRGNLSLMRVNLLAPTTVMLALMLGVLPHGVRGEDRTADIEEAIPAAGPSGAYQEVRRRLEGWLRRFPLPRAEPPAGNAAASAPHAQAVAPPAHLKAEIDAAVAALASDDFHTREAATARLIEFDHFALQPLEQAARSDDAELRFRAAQVVAIVRSRVFITSRLLADHEDVVNAVAFSHGGQQLASGGGGRHIQGQWQPGSDFAIRIWDLATDKVVRTIPGHTAIVYRLVWSESDRFLLSAGGDGTARIWRVDDGSELRAFGGHEGPVTQALFVARESQVVTAGWDGTIRLWDVVTGKQLRSIEWPHGRVWGLDVSPDGTLLAVCGDKPVVGLYHLPTLESAGQLRGHGNNTVAVAFSPDGSQLLTGGWDNAARIWDVQDKSLLRVLAPHTGRVEGVAWSHDGRSVATGSLDNQVRVFSAASGKLVRVYRGHRESISKIDFSPDDRALASGSWDSTIRIWPVVDVVPPDTTEPGRTKDDPPSTDTLPPSTPSVPNAISPPLPPMPVPPEPSPLPH